MNTFLSVALIFFLLIPLAIPALMAWGFRHEQKILCLVFSAEHISNLQRRFRTATVPTFTLVCWFAFLVFSGRLADDDISPPWTASIGQALVRAFEQSPWVPLVGLLVPTAAYAWGYWHIVQGRDARLRPEENDLVGFYAMRHLSSGQFIVLMSGPAGLWDVGSVGFWIYFALLIGNLVVSTKFSVATQPKVWLARQRRKYNSEKVVSNP